MDKNKNVPEEGSGGAKSAKTSEPSHFGRNLTIVVIVLVLVFTFAGLGWAFLKVSEDFVVVKKAELENMKSAEVVPAGENLAMNRSVLPVLSTKEEAEEKEVKEGEAEKSEEKKEEPKAADPIEENVPAADDVATPDEDEEPVVVEEEAPELDDYDFERAIDTIQDAFATLDPDKYDPAQLENSALGL